MNTLGVSIVIVVRSIVRSGVTIDTLQISSAHRHTNPEAPHCWGGRSLLLVRRLCMRATCASVRFGMTGVNIISLPPPSGYIGKAPGYSPAWSDWALSIVIGPSSRLPMTLGPPSAGT